MKKFVLALSLLAPVVACAKQPSLIEELSQALQARVEQAPAAVPKGVATAADFQACPQFFVGGATPRVPNLQQLKPRALCYDAFAVLHSSVSKTPVLVAERLNRAHLDDAKGDTCSDEAGSWQLGGIRIKGRTARARELAPRTMTPLAAWPLAPLTEEMPVLTVAANDT